MASEGGGKIKNKRGPSSSKPYERRKSLFRRITDSIKDVLRPSWLASQGDGESVEIEDSTAGTSEDTGNEETVALSGFLQLNSSQSELRTGSVPLYSNRSSNANQNMQWQQTPKESVSSGSQGQAVGVRPPTWGNTFGMFDKSSFVQKHSESARISDNMMDISAVGLGGLPPPAPSSSTSITAPEPTFPTPAASATLTKRLRLPVPEHPLCTSTSFQQQTEQSVISQDESSLLLSEDNPSKRQRLWSPEVSRKGRSFQTGPQNPPSFKISVFCASSSQNQSLHESSFYSGKTTFGGASAYRRQSLNSSLPYSSSLPIRKSVTPKPLHNPGSAVLSSSANQILKTLERLSDTKKTDSSVSETHSHSLLSFTPKSYRRPSRPIQTSTPSRSVIVPSYGPPVSQMSLPTPARLQPNRQVVSIPVQSRALAASAFTRSPLTEDDEDRMMVTQVPEPLASSTGRVGQGSGKMKHPKSYETRKKPGRPEDEEIVEAPSLRTDFTLPVHSLSTFNLNMPLASSAVSSAGNTAKGWPSTSLSAVPSSTLSSTAVQCQSKLQFTFSSPIQKTGPEASAPPASRSSAVNFQFSSPLSVGQGESSCRQQQSGHAGPEAAVEGSSPASTFVPPAWGSTAPKPKQNLSENSFTFGNNSAVKAVNAASNGGLKPSSELKMGSVMDILGGGSRNTDALSSSSSKAATTLKQGSVMDLLGAGTGKQSASPHVENNNLLAKFAPAVGSWECDSCMLQNKPEASRCVACESSRPGAAKSGTSAVPSKVSSSASESLAKFAAPSGSWECDSCLLQNVPEATKCVACETLKPGAAKPAAPSTDSLMAKFKKPEGSWECDVCMVQNTAAQSKCLACESPRPGAKPSGSSPPSVFSSVPTIGSIGSGGGLVLGSITSSAASPFLASTSAAKDSSATGFSGFGVTATSTASGFGTANPAAPGLTSFGSVTTAPVGFIFGAPTSVAKDLNSGSQNSSNSNNSSAAPGFQFASKDTSSLANSSRPGGSSFGSQDTSNSKDSTAPAGFKFGSQDTSNLKDSSASGGFKFGSQNISSLKDSSVPGGFTFDSKVTFDPNCASLKTTSSDLTSVTVSKSDSAGGFTFRDAASLSSATPSTGGFVFGQPAPSTGQTAVANAPTVATTPAFSFSSTNAEVRRVTQPSSSVAVGSTDSTFKPVFGGVKPANSLPLGAAPSLGGGGTGLTQGGFSFKPSASSGSFNLPSSSASSETSNTKGGFSFVSTDRTASEATPGSQVKPFPFNTPALDKPAVNGDVGGGPVFAFGQQATSAPAGGFSFSAAKTPFVFGADTAVKTEKHPHPDSDLGPSATKKGFGFANPSAIVSSSFKLGQTDAIPSGIFGAPASSFGGSGQSNFALAGAQSNAASSSLFGAGGGSSSASQGQFAFSFGAAGQNSAAAASSFGSDSSSAPGFSFKPTKSFTFGSPAPGVFQFGNSTAETASSQPAMSTAPFMFGSGSGLQSADSTSSASGFSTAPAFGAAQPSFNIGAGTGDNRKIKKAVRRTVRK